MKTGHDKDQHSQPYAPSLSWWLDREYPPNVGGISTGARTALSALLALQASCLPELSTQVACGDAFVDPMDFTWMVGKVEDGLESHPMASSDPLTELSFRREFLIEDGEIIPTVVVTGNLKFPEGRRRGELTVILQEEEFRR